MKNRVYSNEVINFENDTTITLKGWIHSIRELGRIFFWVLRDCMGTVQIVIINPKKRDDYDLIKSIRNEYVVEIIGKVSHNEKAPNGVEVLLDKVSVIAPSISPLPLSVEQKTHANFDTRLKYRYLDVRTFKTRAIFKVRAAVVEGARKYFKNNNFTEIHTPKIISVGAEGGTTLFPVYYFGKEVYLAQSPQFYKQMATLAFEKVFEIGHLKLGPSSELKNPGPADTLQNPGVSTSKSPSLMNRTSWKFKKTFLSLYLTKLNPLAPKNSNCLM